MSTKFIVSRRSMRKGGVVSPTRKRSLLGGAWSSNPPFRLVRCQPTSSTFASTASMQITSPRSAQTRRVAYGVVSPPTRRRSAPSRGLWLVAVMGAAKPGVAGLNKVALAATPSSIMVMLPPARGAHRRCCLLQGHTLRGLQIAPPET
jgi:hypothetical protein